GRDEIAADPSGQVTGDCRLKIHAWFHCRRLHEHCTQRREFEKSRGLDGSLWSSRMDDGSDSLERLSHKRTHCISPTAAPTPPAYACRSRIAADRRFREPEQVAAIRAGSVSNGNTRWVHATVLTADRTAVWLSFRSS